MPELPEVETIRRELLPLLIGRRIAGIELYWENTLRGISAADFNELFAGLLINGLERRGKYLIFKLEGGKCFSIHFRMTGSIISGTDEGGLPRYCRAVIRLDGGLNLFFTDPRKFGCIEVPDVCASFLTRLGPEPLGESFTPEVLAKILTNRKAAVKAVLLDQRSIAGIGNMYADEALFKAGIYPLRPGGSISQDEVGALHSAIRSVLTKAIDRKGATVSDYTRPGGEPGSAQDDFCVAHRRGCSCPCCGNPVERTVVCQRGTYFCPVCQPRV
ncbi:MAG: bifunctional DNA-formamidopyrimidine glycosylase/DNA-(apurinic or apyrimidinic site) lyase [Dehalococcoidales bacterium]|nr:bifunctional DNA-formamidopyrimidine glycosylase/DNA-(apurinic or apyrimidinic site) lyase [Dehalococcoidales bacterium]MDD3264559.1 bifunctional DNA-formamidopyrimidine glycosylase/DNA-(apurinic or apyrimidinic site) lyase [Dehalococcoidales bacterium]MDD4322476.1 bifunctional DNA-formamidopyrimidine glycosylase/DNA-(apurinic or apyrimidinic site) lyase [Dehalococcoidales bacterium]MDD4794463.1 bifunctional DNA-formamidopyrimidine glycosylase/DNA-(apurinic or apyrimidinic site) lyase [Dehalo